MTYTDDPSTPARPAKKANGVGSILKDSKIGAIVSGAIVAICLYIGQVVGQIDVSPLPDILEPAATGLVASISMWFATKFSPRH